MVFLFLFRMQFPIVSQLVYLYINPIIHLYLDNPLSKDQIKILLNQLNKNPDEIIRKNEEKYKTLSLKEANAEELIEAISKNPILLERPIVTNGKTAVIGRPPENVLSIL